MKAFAREPGDPQTSLPSTLRLATHYYKVRPYNLHSARRPARRGVHRPIDHGVDLCKKRPEVRGEWVFLR